MAQRGKTLDFIQEEIEDLADMRWGDRRIFPLLTMLFPHLDSRDGSDIDHVFPKSRFAPTRLTAAQVDEELFDEFRDRSDRLANLQLLHQLNCWTGQSTTRNELRCLPNGWEFIAPALKRVKFIAIGTSLETFQRKSLGSGISTLNAVPDCWVG